MSFTSAQNPSTRYGLIVFLILALFLCAIFFYVRNHKGSVLAHDINELSALKEDYTQIDSCIVLLYNADNNCRLFAVTGEKSYIQKFSSEINFVSNILDNIQSSADNDAKNTPQGLRRLVDQKKIRTQLYLKLRQLTDSLINISTGIDSVHDRQKLDHSKSLTYKQFKTMVAVDTIKQAGEAQQGKKFFGRLADAFSKRKNKATASDTTNKLVRTETKLDTSLKSRNFNRLQLKNMNDYFSKLYAANHMLKNNEIAILQINNRIINEIVGLLKDYKNKEKEFTAQNRIALKNNIDDTFNSIDKIFIFSIILLIMMVSAILYNLWKIYKNESDLINYSHKASQYAISKSRFLANMSHEIR